MIPESHVHLRESSACMSVLFYVWVSDLKCALERISLPVWMCVSGILMRCQLDSSQLITGCTLGVREGLTHSHMLLSVLIFRLGCVMLVSPCTPWVCICSVSPSLTPSVPFRCGSLASSLCEPKFGLMKHLSAIEPFLLSSLSSYHSFSLHAAMAKSLWNTFLCKVALKCNAP